MHVDGCKSVCLMMSLRTPLPTLITLFMSLGVDGTEWSVKYNPTKICALKGSTVFINGSYTYPAGLEVKEEFWVKEPFDREQDTPVYCKPTKDSGTVQCYVDKQQKFSLKLINVTKEDDYYFRIKTNVIEQKWLGDPVKISVTELLVNTLLEVIEREAAVLTCTTTCSLTDSPTFIWYKNGRRLSSNTNPLHLRPVSSEDAGSYMCAVRGYEHLPSPAQTLTVRYPPKNVLVSISPSGEIVEGSSVTLTCSSDANPPVQSYNWFKEKTLLGKESTYIIPNISSEDSGEYKCSSSNEHGSIYSSVILNVMYPPKNVSVSISPSGEIVEDSSMTLTCSSDANPPVQNYTWFKEKTLLGKESTHIIPKISSEDSGEYKCRSSNEHGSKYSSVILNVMYPPKNVSVSISPSGEIVENSSVTLSCSSDANPPVQNYNWFKEGVTSPVGSGETYNITISSNSSTWYYCVAQNEHGMLKSASIHVTLKGHFYILPVALGVGLCGIVFPLSIVLFMKRESLRRGKRQKRNTDESDYGNASLKPCHTCDTSTSSSPIYENTADLRKHH